MILFIAGDLAPTKSNIQLFGNADIGALLGKELYALWNSADLRIFNLETPLADIREPIKKSGPNIVAPTNTIKGIKALNPSLLALANNHILDQGEQGLHSTCEILAKHNISYVGAGNDLAEARLPYILKKNGLSIGFYACAEHEFSIAADKSPGANPFDPLESLEHIRLLKAKCDYVIVLYHGGKEHYRYPSPYLQKVCRKMAQRGADLIVCQHSHCIGCAEKYEGSTIIYGQGNFIFDDSDSEYLQSSLLIRVAIKNGPKIQYVPLIKNKNVVRLADAKAADELLAAFHKRSEEIKQNGFIEKRYQEFAQGSFESYMRGFLGHGKFLARIDKYLLRGYLLKLSCSPKKLLRIENYLACEAHKELALTALKEKYERERS